MLSPAYQTTEDTPDTLLIHGIEDTIVHPSHSQLFYDEMRLKGKKVELHLIEDTQHAFLLAEYVENNPTARRATGLDVEIIDVTLLYIVMRWWLVFILFKYGTKVFRIFKPTFFGNLFDCVISGF